MINIWRMLLLYTEKIIYDDNDPTSNTGRHIMIQMKMGETPILQK